jgi:broad specificity phosphatase PhoE
MLFRVIQKYYFELLQIQMKVDLIFVRHGLSCTNSIAKYSSSIKQITRVFHSDPHVSKFGEVDIESIPQGIFPKKPDVLLASCLLRSIETSLILFPKGKPIVAPYIKEVGFTAGNMPSNIETQVSALHKRFQKVDRVNYEYVEETAYKNNYRKRLFTKAAVSTSMRKFMEWLQENLHSLLNLKSEPSSRRKITVVVIGHSNFMSRFVSSEIKDKPFHLGARKLTYNYSNQTLIMDKIKTRKLKTYRPYCKSEREEAAGEFKIVSDEKKTNEGLLFMGFPLPSKQQFVKVETICHV